MTVYDLLKTAEPQKIAMAGEIRNNSNNTLEDDIIIYTDFIGMLLKKEIIPDTNSVLLGYRKEEIFYDDEYPALEILLYHIDEIKTKRSNIDRFFELISGPDYKDKTNEIWQETKRINLPTGFAFDFTPWEEILGYQVDEKNIEEMGHDSFIAVLLNEMSFNGFSEVQQEKRREELKEAMEELDNILVLYKDNQNAELASTEALFPDVVNFLQKDEKDILMEKSLDNLVKRMETVMGYMEKSRGDS